ncbi:MULTISPECIES: hypothetical protein [unclassified Streptomyces]|uniref:hypothetical protein n=1 Tax=unclassified Streptomyces TaxID=2593676 RepID=UPI0006AE8489|nr:MULTISPECIES: hypothetical protein [unclassified Streptomyces]KOX26601.1 hypothetical protein ADL06_15455 [Streptomyces sp. NRRL F-6491]KOX50019.1 hypothetical protein ADL08_07480 [Streptomyces sp. NRRL F-6492]
MGDVGEFEDFSLRVLSPEEAADDPDRPVALSVLARDSGNPEHPATEFSYRTTSGALARLLAQGRAAQASLAVQRRRQADEADEEAVAQQALTQPAPPDEVLLRRVVGGLRRLPDACPG